MYSNRGCHLDHCAVWFASAWGRQEVRTPWLAVLVRVRQVVRTYAVPAVFTTFNCGSPCNPRFCAALRQSAALRKSVAASQWGPPLANIATANELRRSLSLRSRTLRKNTSLCQSVERWSSVELQASPGVPTLVYCPRTTRTNLTILLWFFLRRFAIWKSLFWLLYIFLKFLVFKYWMISKMKMYSFGGGMRKCGALKWRGLWKTENVCQTRYRCSPVWAVGTSWDGGITTHTHQKVTRKACMKDFMTKMIVKILLM